VNSCIIENKAFEHVSCLLKLNVGLIFLMLIVSCHYVIICPQFVSDVTLSPLFTFQLFKRRNVELINEEAAMFDSLLMDSYVSSTTGVSLSRPGHSYYGHRSQMGSSSVPSVDNPPGIH
jgi:hypothetical protein